MRRIGTVAFLSVLAVAVLAGPAAAKGFDTTRAVVEVQVQADGSLLVTEHITFDFDGAFSGAYRDIPLRPGEKIVDIAVSEDGTVYQPGASAQLGSSGLPDTFGVAQQGNLERIVWHYAAANEQRTFTVSYRFLGLAKAYDDVVDINLQVWGDQWKGGLDSLTATMTLPDTPSDVRVWGHPASVNGTTSLGADGASPALEASGIPAQQFVEMRVVFPRSALTSISGATEIAGDGLPRILTEEEAEAARASRDRTAGRLLAIALVVITFVPALSAVAWLYLRYGREPRVAYDREYEQEPPSDDPPVIVGGLLSQGTVGVPEFTATLFDLIRKGVLTAGPVTVERKTWGGLRTEQISDLEIGLGDTSMALTAAERSVVTVMKRVLASGPQPLTEFRELIREDAAANAETYKVFQKEARKALTRRRLLDRSGAKPMGIIAGVMFGLIFIGMFALAPLSDSRWGAIVVPGLLLAFFVNAVILGVFAISRKGWVKRTRAGAQLAARWEAFRRYLKDFSRLEEAPAISLTLWDRYLVYAVALGVAEDVLKAARLQAPPELEQQSSLYWYGSQGYSGGHSTNALAGLGSALHGAFSPPSSSGG
ncbi:MAG TPA: DUF2207 domain-containing protein, partial [Actinobacteria bacterium]|nr:DUF2207 domain-containing protein [Actinomycetota bacterium]